VKALRYLSSLSIPLLAVLVAGGPLGCEIFQPPSIPSPPMLPTVPEMPTMPEVPSVQTPSAPEAPSTPKVDVPDGEKGAVCCLRSGKAEQYCGGDAKRCCSGRFERDSCEDVGGFWFNSLQGCFGAC